LLFEKRGPANSSLSFALLLPPRDGHFLVTQGLQQVFFIVVAWPATDCLLLAGVMLADLE
jgi:hypothetical protein